MRTCIDQLLALPHIDAPRLKGEVHYLAGRLEQLRMQRTISNEAYLDAGAIQGAIDLVANMIDMGVSQTEIQEHLCLLYTSPSPRDATLSRMPSSA